MERTTKHRILGIFVVIGFVIILLPFFQGGKELQSEAALVKPPAFPDQSVQVTASTQAPVAPISAPPVDAAPVEAAPAVQPQQVATTTTNNAVNEQPDDTIDTSKATVDAKAPDMTNQSTATPEAAAPAADQPAAKTDGAAAPASNSKISDLTPATTVKSADEISQMSDEVLAPEKTDLTAKMPVASSKNDEQVASAETTEPKLEKTVKASKKVAKLAKHVRNPKIVAAYKHLPINDNGLFELKNAVWVIQIGSFKNKTNALKLVNQLRTNGYRAFIQQVSSTLGDNTRVFIGPENKQASARALANQIETDMHLHGIVISYKPLTL